MTQEEDLKTESIAKQVLTTEVKFVIGIIIFVAGIVTPYYGITKDVALIQKDISIININHEAHIQDIMQEIKDLHAADSKTLEELLMLEKNK